MTMWGKLAGRNEGQENRKHRLLGRDFLYARYNADLCAEGLKAPGLPDIKPENVQKLDSIAHLSDLRRVGAKVADEVKIEHFGSFIN